jgi:excisionase family DNA binding protein
MNDEDFADLDDAPTDLWIRPDSPTPLPSPPAPDRDVVRAAVREGTRELRNLLRELVADPGRRDSSGGLAVPRYLNPIEAARMAGVQVQTIQRWVRAGKLRGHSAGRVLRIRQDDLQAFLARGPSTAETLSDADLEARANAILRRKKRTGQETR